MFEVRNKSRSKVGSKTRGAERADSQLTSEMKARINQILRDGHMTTDEIAAACGTSLEYAHSRAIALAADQLAEKHKQSQRQPFIPPKKNDCFAEPREVGTYKCPGCSRLVVLYPCQICRALKARAQRRNELRMTNPSLK